MSGRRLKLIGFKKSFVDYDDDTEYKNFFCEIDNMYFKLKSKEWWETLKAEEDEEKWMSDLSSFLADVGVREEKSKLRRVIATAVLDVIIGKMYNENEQAQQLTGALYLEKEEARAKQSQNTQNPLNLMDYSSPEFASKVHELCRLLGITEHPNPVVSLKAACLFINDNLNADIIKERNAERKSGKTPDTIELRSFPLDLSEHKDGAVNACARILRLLNIETLRNTQTKVNETLVAIQNLTIDETKKPAVGQVKYGF
ncbi:hypothetical protein Q1695_010933 [Nippostrongylus brasiliensis]|nr:hypothetical protein Q1695_010933 [Nippostrongylus brasiliensis]